MTFGRPTMISSASDVPAPLMIDDEYLLIVGEGVQPEGTPSRMALFVCSLRLYDILRDVLSKFYKDDLNQRPVPDVTLSRSQHMVTDTLALNHRLDEFLDHVPAYVRAADTPLASHVHNEENHTRLQERILYSRLVNSCREDQIIKFFTGSFILDLFCCGLSCYLPQIQTSREQIPPLCEDFLDWTSA
jgi:hypothetical protein